MRTAAGVLLIIAAVINLFAGLAYLGGGAVLGGAGKLTAMAAEKSKREGRELTEKQKEEFAEINRASKEMGPAVKLVMAYGLFLLVTVGTSIAGAVCLFRQRAAKFIIAAAALSLVAEVLSCAVAIALVGAAVGVTKVVLSAAGLLGGVFALVGARQILAANAVPAMPPPAAASM